jgi:hypothetical protein
MNTSLQSVSQVASLIQNKRVLLLAGDESVLDQLPDGNWIAGTIPYFMSPDGGLFSKEKIHVIDLTDTVSSFKMMSYDEHSIKDIVSDEYENGFSVLILPALQPVWQTFALDAPSYPDLFTNPLIGWVSGIEFSDLGKVTPKTYLGNRKSENLGVVMHVAIPDEYIARTNIINLYRPGSGETIQFQKKGFDSNECIVNGETHNLYHYLRDRQASENLPLVADYSGASINVGILWDHANQQANLVGPVFPEVDYRLPDIAEMNYEAAFEEAYLQEENKDFTFACNCVMNYFTFGLEGKQLQGLSGPVTFGEIAYQLLNQTFVYLIIEKR